jgi:hypothetical protein
MRDHIGCLRVNGRTRLLLETDGGAVFRVG